MFSNKNFKIKNGRQFIDQVITASNHLLDQISYWRSAYAKLKRDNASLVEENRRLKEELSRSLSNI